MNISELAAYKFTSVTGITSINLENAINLLIPHKSGDRWWDGPFFGAGLGYLVGGFLSALLKERWMTYMNEEPIKVLEEAGRDALPGQIIGGLLGLAMGTWAEIENYL